MEINDKSLCVFTDEIQTDGKDTYDYHRYEPTDYSVLDTLFDFFTPNPDDVLIDYGCGLGRLNFYLERRFHIHTIGTESNAHYYVLAEKKRKNYRGDAKKIQFLCMKAENYTVREQDNIFYFFYPFSVTIFRLVINQILSSWQNHPRTITLLLYYPDDEVIFYLEHHTLFSLTDEIASSEKISHDRKERFCIYSIQSFV